MDTNTSGRGRVLTHPDNKKTLGTDLRVLDVIWQQVQATYTTNKKNHSSKTNACFLNGHIAFYFTLEGNFYFSYRIDKQILTIREHRCHIMKQLKYNTKWIMEKKKFLSSKCQNL